MAEVKERLSLEQFKTDVAGLKASAEYSKNKAKYAGVMQTMEEMVLPFVPDPFIGKYKLLVAVEGIAVRGVLTMEKQVQGYWTINDVIAIGCGFLLAEEAVRLAQKDCPAAEVGLTSETEQSTQFWTGAGFLKRNPKDKDTSVAMYLPPKAKLINKKAPVEKKM